MNKLLQFIAYLMTMIFLFSVIVQYNDPDALIWVGIYGLAAVITILFLVNRLSWLSSAVMGAGAFIWLLILAPRVIGKTSFSSLFEAWEMQNTIVEEAREMGGLLIIFVRMLILTVAVRKRN